MLCPAQGGALGKCGYGAVSHRGTFRAIRNITCWRSHLYFLPRCSFERGDSSGGRTHIQSARSVETALVAPHGWPLSCWVTFYRIMSVLTRQVQRGSWVTNNNISSIWFCCRVEYLKEHLKKSYSYDTVKCWEIISLRRPVGFCIY